MKKQIFKACLILALCAAGTSVYAQGTITSTGTSIGTQTYKPSNNVTVLVTSLSGTSTDPGGYVAVSYHASGDRMFGTNSAQPKIYWNAKNPPNTLTVTDSQSFAPDITSWTSL